MQELEDELAKAREQARHEKDPGLENHRSGYPPRADLGTIALFHPVNTKEVNHADQACVGSARRAGGGRAGCEGSLAVGCVRWSADICPAPVRGATRPSSPHHTHPYEHEIYILNGQAKLRAESQEHALGPGDTVLVLPDELHQVVNAGREVLRFLCAIPLIA